MNHSDINKAITNRSLFTGREEGTYFTGELYDYVCDNHDDPFILFKLAVYGYYAKEYKWTREQADQFIEDHKENSIKWTDGVNEYYYDWGKGKNLITSDYLHVPNLDHIVPKSLGGKDVPGNLRIRCRRLNENRGNTNSDKERRATIIDLYQDMSSDEQQKLIIYLESLGKLNIDNLNNK
jgi:hypothetical protein